MAIPNVTKIDRRELKFQMPRCSGTVTDAVYAWRLHSGLGDRCTRQSQVMINGAPYCSLHGGLVLLNWALDNTAGTSQQAERPPRPDPSMPFKKS